MLPANTIYEGDATQLLRRQPAESVDLICTDPPYGNNTAYGLGHRTIANDTSPLIGLLGLEEAIRTLKRNRFCICFLGQTHLPFFDNFIRRYTALKIRSYIVWDKARIGLGYGVRPQHELIAVLEKGRPPFSNSGIPSVLTFARASATHHPHAKPVELLRYLIHNFSSPGQLVLDPFVGSGSTAVAAKLLDRRYIGIEIDPAHVKVARHRVDTTEQK